MNDDKQKQQVEKPKSAQKTAEKEKQKRLNEQFKRKYFDFYDDVKISHREDW